MTQVLFRLGSINFYTHGFFLVIAMVLAGSLLYYLAKSSKRSTEPIFDLVVFSLLVGVIFARLNYFLLYRAQFASFSDLFRVWQGGLVSWGGFIAGIICFIIILRIYKQPTKPWLDMLGIVGLLGISIGRTGSFLSGEYAGKATSLPWAVSGVHPVTIYEAVILFVAFLLILSLFLKHKIKQHGIYFFFIILVYSLVRFGLDFLRTDHIYWSGLTLTQLTSAVIALSIIGYLVVTMGTAKKGAGHAGF